MEHSIYPPRWELRQVLLSTGDNATGCRFYRSKSSEFQRKCTQVRTVPAHRSFTDSGNIVHFKLISFHICHKAQFKIGLISYSQIAIALFSQTRTHIALHCALCRYSDKQTFVIWCVNKIWNQWMLNVTWWQEKTNTPNCCSKDLKQRFVVCLP